jgi:hypothetical protein
MTARRAADLGRTARTALVISVVLTIALYAVPYGHHLAYPLMLLSTLVHELGHGIAAILMGGEFAEFRMWSNGSGVARSAVEPGAAHAFVSAGGLCGPAVAAAVFLWLGRSPVWAKRCLAAFGVFLLIALLLWVRGGFAIAFVGAVGAACVAIAVLTTAETAQIALVFVATQLALSVYSRGDYLFMQWANTGAGKMPSDVQRMAEALGGPYWFWGGLCAAFSAAVLLAAGWLYLRPSSRGSGAGGALTARRPSPRSTPRAP